MIPSKQSLGINGEHKALGREITMLEFKGFMISEVSNIKDSVKEIKEENSKQWKVIVKNRSRLDVIKGQAMTRAFFVSAGVSICLIVIAWVGTNLDKLVKAFGG